MKLSKFTCVFLATTLFTVFFYGTTFAETTAQNTTKRYIIKFKTNSVDGSKFVSKYSGKFKHQFKHINGAVAEITTQGLANLQKDSNVDYVEEDNPVKASTIYTDWGISDIKANTSQSSGLTGKGVKIAIIDTGAGPHIDLSITGGVNVISGASTTAYSDDNGHGTHVAGIVAGQGLNGGVVGVAPGASVYAVKALDSTGSGYTSDIITGIDWAIENNMNIISMSLGSSSSDTSLKNAVDTAYADGLLVVAAAGNDGNSAETGTNTEYPANYASVIAVGAVDSTNTRAYFSSTGSKVEVAAPGVSVQSTYLNNTYQTMSGTSMATPFVAGDLALLKQEYPSYTNVQLRSLLDSKVVDLGSTGRDPLYGYGLIQAPVLTTATPIIPVTAVTIPVPTASSPSGSYKLPLMIQIRDTYTKPLKGYYTLDGTTPTTKSILYSGFIPITSSCTLKVIVVDSLGNTSAVMSNTYTIVKPPANPTSNLRGGVYSKTQTITLSDSTPGVAIYYTTNGSVPTAKSTLYTGPIIIKSTTTITAVAIDSTGSSSQVVYAVYIIAGK